MHTAYARSQMANAHCTFVDFAQNNNVRTRNALICRLCTEEAAPEVAGSRRRR